MNLTFVNLAVVGYFLAGIFYSITSIFKIKYCVRGVTLIISIGFAFHTIHLINRWYVSQRLPAVSLYETMVFFAWAIMLIYLILERIYKLKFLEIPVSTLAALILAYTSILDKSIKPLMPALKSNWLIIHVTSYFIGYAGVAISFLASIGYLFPGSRHRREDLDSLSFRLVAFSFPFLTLGLTTGAVWAKAAWGAYWSWDPKETWALISWSVYAVYLHQRLLKNWQGKRCAYVNIIGFLSLLFTFFGVNYLLKGMHSYL